MSTWGPVALRCLGLFLCVCYILYFLQHDSFAEGESWWNASEMVLDLVDL